ncbi:MAG TPA: PQQ-dependent sugar dehydrogenase, partial [Polyangiaceae bacterium]|nr:PQQ-dependent sugar dehydrogenase [Polyangiaceae bacterium]
NCGLDLGLTSWATDIFFEGAAGTISAANGELELVTNSCGSVGWNVQPRQEGLSLEPNLAYEVRFRGRASAPRRLFVSMTKNGPPWTSYTGYQEFELGTEMQDYSFRFTMAPEGDPSVKFEIQAGFDGDFEPFGPMPTLYLDDLYLAPVIISPDRPSNTSCFAGPAPTASVLTQQYWAGVPLVEPLETVQVPAAAGDSFLVVEKAGRVLQLTSDPNDATVRQFFHVNELSPPDQPLSTDGESGMTALAFHPNFGQSGAVGERTIFVGYTRLAAPEPGEEYGADLVLASFQTDETGTAVNLTSKVELVRVHQDSPIHNSGDIEFGPDGLLYMSVGDDGNNTSGDDNPGKANDPTQPNGKIFRLSPAQYDGAATLAWSDVELVAMGLRNPWRLSFDGNDLWIGNVGFDKIEEVNRLDLTTDIGVHFGWPYCEGDVCCDEGIDCSSLPPMPADLRFPEYQYRRSTGPSGESAVIGGYVYRGSLMPELQGKYVFGDFADQVIYALDPASGQAEPILSNIGNVDDFGVDQQGELFFTTLGGGVFRVVPGVEGPNDWPPQDLMAWGCFDSLGDGHPVPASGVLGYELAQTFWSDGAEKQRFVAVPDGTFIDVADPNDWQLPIGGVTIKNFYWAGQIFETRLFVRHDNGLYGGYTYRWNGPNEATLVPPEGAEQDLGDIVWQYPSRAQCMTCHTAAAGRSLGLETRQLNVGDQLAALTDLTLLSSSTPAVLAPYPNILDESVDLGTRAESYLHVNCSSCHRGPTQSDAGRARWDARFDTLFANKGVCDVAPVESVSGNPLERLLAPGDHELSTIWLRAHQRDNLFMPPLATVRVDTDGVALLEQWIDGLAGCVP